MYNDIAKYKGKWLLLIMQPFLATAHITAVRLNEKNVIVFKDKFNSAESVELHGPNGLYWKNWASFVPKSDDLQMCKLFFYSIGGLRGAKYYDHSAQEANENM
jgi:hypothetical protein